MIFRALFVGNSQTRRPPSLDSATMPTMTKAEKFLEMKYLSGHLEEVPGLGEVGIGNLKKKKINTTYQLIGEFLRLNRDEGAMYKFLVEQGNREQDVKRTAEYLRK